MATSIATSGLAVKNLSATRSAFSGAAVSAPQQVSTVKVASFQCRASAEESEAVSRRSALALVAGAAALSLKASPALAAYGEAANVFGKAPGTTDYIPYKGEGFTIDIPSKWNPSKEAAEFPGIVLRWEDNFDALCNLTVLKVPTSLSSAKDLSADEFLSKYNYLFGVQSFDKETVSEGGFAPGKAVSAALLDEPEYKTVDGKTYLNLNVLVRSADGNEGGRHQLYSVAVSGGKLYIARVQAGDKRWFKGAKKFVEGAAKSFAVA